MSKLCQMSPSDQSCKAKTRDFPLKPLRTMLDNYAIRTGRTSWIAIHNMRNARYIITSICLRIKNHRSVQHVVPYRDAVQHVVGSICDVYPDVCTVRLVRHAKDNKSKILIENHEYNTKIQKVLYGIIAYSFMVSCLDFNTSTSTSTIIL